MDDGYVNKQTAIDAIAKAMPSLTTPDGCGEFDHDIQIADEAFVDSMQIIHGLPSADVVDVVRCKDCIHFEEHKNYGNLGESAYTCAGNMDGWIYPDSYCSRGERRDG